MPLPPPPPECEHTNPGSTIEGIDCWDEARFRHVNSEGVTIGVFCPAHNLPNQTPQVTVEEIELTEPYYDFG